MLRLLTWNIRAGGGSRIAPIVAALAPWEGDVLVLTEYRDGLAGQSLRAALLHLGYRWMTAQGPPKGCNGVLIAARRPFREMGPVSTTVAEPWRLLDVTLGSVRLTGVYMPNLRVKIPYWEALIQSLATRASRSALALGDFNTCRAFVDEAGSTDVTSHFLDKMENAGFRDVWRDRNPDGREFTWYSTRGNGFRIDHAFLSSRLARRAADVRYVHEVRAVGLSDHSMMLVDLR